MLIKCHYCDKKLKQCENCGIYLNASTSLKIHQNSKKCKEKKTIVPPYPTHISCYRDHKGKSSYKIASRLVYRYILPRLTEEIYRDSLKPIEVLKSYTYDTDDTCAICLETFTSTEEKVVNLKKCKGHGFHQKCLEKWLKYKSDCPLCKKSAPVQSFGSLPNGKMEVYERSDVKLEDFDGNIYLIKYYIESGIQLSMHQNPSLPFYGTRRTAYLPKSTEGLDSLNLLIKAFNNRQTFKITRSLTTGMDNIICWNIPHITKTSGGITHFGYPDRSYHERLTSQMDIFSLI